MTAFFHRGINAPARKKNNASARFVTAESGQAGTITIWTGQGHQHQMRRDYGTAIKEDTLRRPLKCITAKM